MVPRTEKVHITDNFVGGVGEITWKSCLIYFNLRQGKNPRFLRTETDFGSIEWYYQLKVPTSFFLVLIKLIIFLILYYIWYLIKQVSGMRLV